MNKYKTDILFFLAVTILEILFIFILLMSQNVDCGTKIVKCYDRNNNEIIGQNCQQENYCIGNEAVIFGIIFSSILCIIINSLTFINEGF